MNRVGSGPGDRDGGWSGIIRHGSGGAADPPARPAGPKGFQSSHLMEDIGTSFPDPKSLVRPHILGLAAYTPGEQPTASDVIKLNTNENAYPPAPPVRRAIREAADGRLRRYPDPSASGLRRKLAAIHGCRPENLLIGNGSDELLALATRAFVEPGGSETVAEAGGPSKVQFFSPSYSLYPVLAAIHHARQTSVGLPADFHLPAAEELNRDPHWDPRAALTFVTTPHAPSGRGYGTKELESLCRALRGVVVLDEAYADFADENALELALRYPHVLVSRTFSKGYALCFQRVGYLVGDPELIQALDKIRDSYNVNGLGQIAALKALESPDYYRRVFDRIRRERRRLAGHLTRLGFEVFPSQTNFLLVRPPEGEARRWQEALARQKVLVRWFDHPAVSDCLRITIGTRSEVSTLLHAIRAILSEGDHEGKKSKEHRGR